MLIKVTNFCSMGCSHCMEDSTVAGSHMSENTFGRALDMTVRVETLAWQMGCIPLILLSGGECTEHPDIIRFIQEVMSRNMWPLLITNGMWLNNKDLREAILRSEWDNIFIQITNDKRFYPSAPPLVEDKRISYVDRIERLLPLGRASRKRSNLGVPSMRAPTSFNLRSLTRVYGSIEKAVLALRVRATSGAAGHCTPSISDTGSVQAGESRICFKIGTVDSSNEELTRNLIGMRCNACGLVDNLTLEQKRAIGESSLYAGNEK